MLYQKKSEPTLQDGLFANPTSEYRGAPFWAWNNHLDPKELTWKIEQFKKDLMWADVVWKNKR